MASAYPGPVSAVQVRFNPETLRQHCPNSESSKFMMKYKICYFVASNGYVVVLCGLLTGWLLLCGTVLSSSSTTA